MEMNAARMTYLVQYDKDVLGVGGLDPKLLVGPARPCERGTRDIGRCCCWRWRVLLPIALLGRRQRQGLARLFGPTHFHARSPFSILKEIETSNTSRTPHHNPSKLISVHFEHYVSDLDVDRGAKRSANTPGEALR